MGARVDVVPAIADPVIAKSETASRQIAFKRRPDGNSQQRSASIAFLKQVAFR